MVILDAPAAALVDPAGRPRPPASAAPLEAQAIAARAAIDQLEADRDRTRLLAVADYYRQRQLAANALADYLECQARLRDAGSRYRRILTRSTAGELGDDLDVAGVALLTFRAGCSADGQRALARELARLAVEANEAAQGRW